MPISVSTLPPPATASQLEAQRKLCDALAARLRSAQGDLNTLRQQDDGLARQRQALDVQVKPYQRRAVIFDRLGKAGAGIVIGGLAAFGFNPLIGAGMVLGGLAGFCACYIPYARQMAALRGADAMAASLQGERSQLVPVLASAQANVAFAQTRLDSAQQQLNALQLTRMASAANAGPVGGAVTVGSDAVTIGTVRVPRKTVA